MDVRIYADEVVANLQRLPIEIRESVRAKMEEVITSLKERTFSKPPGEFLDQSTITGEVTTIGNMVVGSLESNDKGGVYTILPSKAQVLKFMSKSEELVFAKAVYNHPYLKGTSIVRQTLEEMKPWIVEELEAAVVEAL